MNLANLKSYRYPADILQDRVILITGASDGIGKALALHVAGLGARVILHGRNVRKLEAVYDAIEAIDGAPRPSIAVLDFATAGSDAYQALADSLTAEFGRLDGLVHNAGILGDRFALEQYDIEQWQRVLHVNLTAAFLLTQVCLPLLKASADGSIVFTSSSVGRAGRAFWGAYAVSKFATEGLAQVLADELRHSSVRVNCINPGATRTRMRLEAYPAEARDSVKAPEAVLPGYVFLLGPDSTGVTGESLDIK